MSVLPSVEEKPSELDLLVNAQRATENAQMHAETMATLLHALSDCFPIGFFLYITHTETNDHYEQSSVNWRVDMATGRRADDFGC